MSVVRLYLRSSQTEPSTGGDSYDMLPDQGSGNGGTQFSFNSTSFVEAGRFIRQLSAAPEATTFPVAVNVTAIEGTIEYRFRVERSTSAGAFVEAGSYSALHSTTGAKSETLSFTPSGWNAGDLLVLTMEGRRSGGHGTVRFTVAVQDAASYVDADLAAPPPDPVTVTPTPRGGTGGALMSLVAGAVIAGSAGGVGGGASALEEGNPPADALAVVVWTAGMDQTGTPPDLEVVIWEGSLDQQASQLALDPIPAGATGGGGGTLASGASVVPAPAGASGGGSASVLTGAGLPLSPAGAEGGGAGTVAARAGIAAQPSGATGGGTATVQQGSPAVTALEVVIWEATLDAEQEVAAILALPTGAEGGAAGAVRARAVTQPAQTGAGGGAGGGIQARAEVRGLAGASSSATGIVTQSELGEDQALHPTPTGGAGGASGAIQAGASVAGSGGATSRAVARLALPPGEALVTLNGVSYPVAQLPRRVPVLVKRVARRFDGTPSTQGIGVARVSDWHVVFGSMPYADALELLELLEGPEPIQFGGTHGAGGALVVALDPEIRVSQSLELCLVSCVLREEVAL